jgi:uncharacterized protein YndB with AHSA1/START domain
VFDAFTNPELLKRWLFGPDGWSLTVCDIDLRVSGKVQSLAFCSSCACAAASRAIGTR